MPRRNFGDHTVDWSPSENKIVIKPRYKNATTTEWFGLGNAKIQINVGNLPSEIVAPITGETTGEGILPTSAFGLKRWVAMPTGLHDVSKVVTGFNGWSETITYKEAGGGGVKEVSSTGIKQIGYGSSKIYDGQRVSW